MKKAMKFLIPLLSLLGIKFIPFIISRWTMKYVQLPFGTPLVKPWFIYSMGVLDLLIFCAAYFLTGLTIKNRKNIVWFSIPCAVYVIIPSLLLGIVDIAYSFTSFIISIQLSLYAAIFYLAVNWFEKNKRVKELEK